MKKRLFIILLALTLVFTFIPVMASDSTDTTDDAQTATAVPEDNTDDAAAKWDEIYKTDFEEGLAGGDFYSFFNTYDIDGENIVTENDNTYYYGRFPKGLKVNYIWEAEEYRVAFDIKTQVADPETQNAYKTVLLLQHSITGMGVVNEPDNNDEDKTSFQGMSGVGIYMWDNVLEVCITTNKDGGTAGPVNGIGKTGVVDKASDRLLGVYGISYQFTLPETMNFSEFRHVDISLKDGVITVYVDEQLICTVELSQVEEITTMCNENHWNKNIAGTELIDDEDVYRNAVIKDAQGQEVLAVDSAVVMKSGTFVFSNRCAPFGLDNLTVYEPHVDKPVITPAPSTQAPTQTEAPTKTDAPSETQDPTGSEPADQNSNSLKVIIIVCAIVAVIAIFVVVIVTGKKKK